MDIHVNDILKMKKAHPCGSQECRLLVELLDVNPLHFTSNHASNYLPLKGGLPEDREKFLSLIDQALEGKIRLRKTLNRGI